jgi:hypothetical protein
MHGPTCIFWANLTPFSLKGPLPDFAALAALAHKHGPWPLTQGVPGVPQDPFAPRRGPLGPSRDWDSAIGNACTLDSVFQHRWLHSKTILQLLTELSPTGTASP